MRIEYKGEAPYYDYDMKENVITINGKEFDLDKLREDTEKEINIYDEDKNFVANIIIPPNEYEFVDTGKKDENGDPIYEKILKPLNLEKVRLVLWQKIEKPKNQLSEEV